MIRRYIYGNPLETDAVMNKPDISRNKVPYLGKSENTLIYKMSDKDIVYGLGENVRGINKRGWIYVSNCTDDPLHREDTRSLYGAHNFMIISGKKTFGLFIDTPGIVTFDVGYSDYNQLKITLEEGDYELYLLEDSSPDGIVKQFRQIIGRSYIPPKWAFGYGQSRWSYRTSDEVRTVAKMYRKNHIPLDSIYLDIDYMERYKDFTIDRDAFPDFEQLTEEMKKQGIHLVPIIDAGVKIEEGYDIYEEGVANNYFCKDSDHEDFVVSVWMGKCHFPDMLDDEARTWFGSKYKFLLDKGIEGFWNDMNAPAIFYNPEDYRSFYHQYKGKRIRHDKVHNLFGYYMTRSAAEAFGRIEPDKRILIFSRASYIGMHRYGGIWMGDNMSWWSHLAMNLKMLPSLNMCGFLYTGADLGGFGADATEDLLLRWLALGIFTPLMRNHSADGTRRQEAYAFEKLPAFRELIGLRYRLLPYIYSEFMKAALADTMYSRPLGFAYPGDELACHVEDQLLIGESVMIAPVYEQNAVGRTIYLPEEMKLLRFKHEEIIEECTLEKGYHFIWVPLDEVVLFIRKGHLLPLARGGENVTEVDWNNLSIYHFAKKGNSYELYNDDGYSKRVNLDENVRKIVLR